MNDVIDPKTGKAAPKTYRDMRQMTIEPNDLIVMRTDVEWTVEDMMKFDEQMHQSYPDWGGTIIMMRTDESLEKVPAAAVQALYEKLRPQFDPEYDEWKRGRDNDTTTHGEGGDDVSAAANPLTPSPFPEEEGGSNGVEPGGGDRPEGTGATDSESGAVETAVE